MSVDLIVSHHSHSAAHTTTVFYVSGVVPHYALGTDVSVHSKLYHKVEIYLLGEKRQSGRMSAICQSWNTKHCCHRQFARSTGRERFPQHFTRVRSMLVAGPL